MTLPSFLSFFRFAVALTTLVAVAGCTTYNQREYEPLVRELDGFNELEISTYPADFPTRLTDKKALFQKYDTSGDLYFQVFIRDKENKTGKNPHVRSIRIHTFSYQLDGGTPIVLLSNYTNNFWMQGNPRYEARDLPPVAYVTGGKISVRIAFTLNGNDYEFEGDMTATESSWTLPSFIADQSV